MLLFGVTGNIACGKSTVDAMLHELAGATIIDADRVTHDLLRDDSTVRDAIVNAFGSATLSDDGRIDRRSLGRIVFADPQALRRLEAIVHPAVRRQIRAELANMPEDSIAVIDAVKLLEGELGTLVQSVWWVTARPEQQLDRLIRLRGLTEADARARIAAQPALDRWRDRVNVVIDNSGSLAETRDQVRMALDSVLAANATNPAAANRDT
ncbi:MAG: Dephospho-CoA kinase [Chloroflexi bacterium]|nr:Dephospho-CoA kinase [Chloroflexota bacterium]